MPKASRRTISDTGSRRAGNTALALGTLAAAATVFTYALSLGQAFNPPSWIRAVGLVWLPLGFFGAPVAYAVARDGPGENRALTGLAVAGLGLLGFVALLFIVG